LSQESLGNEASTDTLTVELQKLTSSQKSRRTAYIKADARVPYAAVVKIIDFAIAAGFKRTVLLTSQSEPEPRAIAPPKGFTVMNARPGLPQ
jgi:biopolymer transport protein ExbD